MPETSCPGLLLCNFMVRYRSASSKNLVHARLSSRDIIMAYIVLTSVFLHHLRYNNHAAIRSRRSSAITDASIRLSSSNLRIFFKYTSLSTFVTNESITYSCCSRERSINRRNVTILLLLGLFKKDHNPSLPCATP